jgi:hypothetical protein
VIKHNFDQTPVLLENFDQVIRSSEIRSSDPLSPNLVFKKLEHKTVIKLSNGHLPQICQNGELLVRMCRGESHFWSILAKFAGANVSSPG